MFLLLLKLNKDSSPNSSLTLGNNIPVSISLDNFDSGKQHSSPLMPNSLSFGGAHHSINNKSSPITTKMTVNDDQDEKNAFNQRQQEIYNLPSIELPPQQQQQQQQNNDEDDCDDDGYGNLKANKNSIETTNNKSSTGDLNQLSLCQSEANSFYASPLSFNEPSMIKQQQADSTTPTGSSMKLGFVDDESSSPCVTSKPATTVSIDDPISSFSSSSSPDSKNYNQHEETSESQLLVTASEGEMSFGTTSGGELNIENTILGVDNDAAELTHTTANNNLTNLVIESNMDLNEFMHKQQQQQQQTLIIGNIHVNENATIVNYNNANNDELDGHFEIKPQQQSSNDHHHHIAPAKDKLSSSSSSSSSASNDEMASSSSSSSSSSNTSKSSSTISSPDASPAKQNNEDDDLVHIKIDDNDNMPIKLDLEIQRDPTSPQHQQHHEHINNEKEVKKEEEELQNESQIEKQSESITRANANVDELNSSDNKQEEKNRTQISAKEEEEEIELNHSREASQLVVETIQKCVEQVQEMAAAAAADDEKKRIVQEILVESEKVSETKSISSSKTSTSSLIVKETSESASIQQQQQQQQQMAAEMDKIEKCNETTLLNETTATVNQSSKSTTTKSKQQKDPIVDCFSCSIL